MTPSVTSLSCTRGRSTALDEIEAGEATLVFDNPIGVFTPGKSRISIFMERFGDFGTSGAGSTFSLGSGLWEHLGTGSTSRSVAAGASGLVITGTVAEAGHLAGMVELSNRGYAVTPGQTLTVTVRVKADNPAHLTTVKTHTGFTNAAGVALTTDVGTASVSNGQFVTVTQTVTVPATAAFVRPGVAGYPNAGAGATVHTLTVSSLRVEIPAPYAGKVVPRKPIRTYVVTDGNWVHWECVNASTADMSAPRWELSNNLSPANFWESQSLVTPSAGLVSKVFDATLGRDVFEFAAKTGPAAFTVFRAGVAGDSDAIPVKVGDVLTCDLDLANMCTGGIPSSASAYLQTYDYTGTPVDTGTTVSTSTLGAWSHKTFSVTSTIAGFCRLNVRGDDGSGVKALFRVANVKIQKGTPGSGVPATMSGIYPIFRGFVEKWTSVHGTSSSEVTAECVDALSVLVTPTHSPYRAMMETKFRNFGKPEFFYYWPCVQGSDDVRADPQMGDLPLTIATSSTAPTTGGFTSDKTMIHGDGDESGGFTVDDSTNGVGAVLRLNNYSQPAVGTTWPWGVDLWYTPTAMPAAQNHTLFAMIRADGSVIASMEVLSTGAVQFFYSANGSGASDLTLTTATGLVRVGVPVHIGMTAAPNTVAHNTTVHGLVDAVDVSGTQTVENPLPSVAFTQFGGQLYGATSKNFIRGTINHIVFMTDSLTSYNLPDIHGLATLSGVLDPESETAEMSRVLGSIDWQGSASFDSPLSSLLSARWDEAADAAETLGKAADSAGGLFMIGGAGELTYHNRQRRMGAPARWTVAEFGDVLNFEMDDARIFNHVKAERSTGMFRTAVDEVSASEFGARQLDVTRNTADPLELQDAASWLLHRYKEISPRCEALTVDASALVAGTDNGLLSLAYGAAVSQRIILDDLPDSAPSSQLDFFIEGLSIAAEFGDSPSWITSLNISDASRSEAWILEDATFGLLDSDLCVLVY